MQQYDRVIWRGAYMTRRQRQALIATENHIRKEHPNWDFRFTVPQGSWRPITSWSGSSHTGAGIVDLQYAGFYGTVGFSTRRQQDKAKYILRKLREVGHQGAMLRGAKDGMVNHFHVMDLDTHGMSDTSKTFQVPEYRRGNDALDFGVKDRYPYRPDRIRRWTYKK